MIPFPSCVVGKGLGEASPGLPRTTRTEEEMEAIGHYRTDKCNLRFLIMDANGDFKT